MKIFLVFGSIIFCAVLFASCSKSSTNSSSGTTNSSSTGTTTITQVASNTATLAGFDKTDTLKVMAYNVLTYGDGCQGNVTILNGYLKTIIQYAQPDLLSCEKMYAFPAAPGNILNLADNITNNVLNSAFPGRYAMQHLPIFRVVVMCQLCFITSKN